MSVQVRLTISGLCMFVPDEEEDRSTLHVLMPTHRAASGHDAHGHHDAAHSGAAHHAEHFARLVYDRAYHRPGEVPAGPGRNHCVPLDGCAVKVQGHGTARPEVDEQCVAVLDEKVNFKGVERACIPSRGDHSPLHTRVHARLELRGVDFPAEYVGHPRCLAPSGKKCNDPGAFKPRFMAQHVRWDLGPFEGDDVALAGILSAVPKARPLELPRGRLRPQNGRVELRIAYAIRHVIDGLCADTGPGPYHGDDHFPMYYGLAVDGSGPPYVTQAGPEKVPSDVCNPTLARLAPRL